MKRFGTVALGLALVSGGCGAPSDVLYVGSALGEAGFADTGGPPETGAPVEASGDGPVGVIDAGDAGGTFDSVCTPVVDFQNLDPQGGGKVFLDNVKGPNDFVQTLTRKVCAILYRSAPEVPPISKITLVVQPIPNISANTTGTAAGTTMTINSNF